MDDSSINISNYELIIDILNGIHDSTGMDTIFISRKFHSALSKMDLGV